jgi:hypothetical protein
LGVGTDPTGWTGNISNYLYTGPNGFNQYKAILTSHGFDVSNLAGVPIEDSFGNGTQGSHFEEGSSAITSFGLNTQYFYVSGIEYPTIPQELMSGYLNGGNNYFSNMTLGVLEDFGYMVNYSSTYVMNPPLNHIRYSVSLKNGVSLRIRDDVEEVKGDEKNITSSFKIKCDCSNSNICTVNSFKFVPDNLKST